MSLNKKIPREEEKETSEIISQINKTNKKKAGKCHHYIRRRFIFI